MKRVFRDSFNGILGGVCSGLGEYFEIDPVIFLYYYLLSFSLCLVGEYLFI